MTATATAVTAEMALPNNWALKVHGPNALTLDTAQVQIGEGEWSKPMHILDAHAAVARAGFGAEFGLRFTLAADVAPTGPISLPLSRRSASRSW